LSPDFEYLVPAEHAGIRLDLLLANLVTDGSRARIQALIQEGHVLVDGKRPKAGLRLKGGEAVVATWPAARPYEVAPQDMGLTILHEDDSLAIVQKPRGVATHPAPGSWEGTLVHGLLHALDGLSGIGGTLRPGIVHRLDKDTTGLLVVAKNDAAHLALCRALQDRRIKRTYMALVHGRPAAATGTVDRAIGRHPVDRKRMAIQEGGKRAVTHYTTLEAFRDASLLELELDTGRTHQIRVHMASIGHPVIGDPVYGPATRSSPMRLEGQLLHAVRLALAHPVDGRPMQFEAPLPEDFERALKLVRQRGYWRG